MEMLVFSAFNRRTLNDFLAVITIAERAGISSVDDLKSHIVHSINDMVPYEHRGTLKNRRTQRLNAEELGRRFRSIRCPICNQWMRILPVNDSKSTMVGGDYKSCGVCYNRDCLHTEFFLESVDEVSRKEE